MRGEHVRGRRIRENSVYRERPSKLVGSKSFDSKKQLGRVRIDRSRVLSRIWRSCVCRATWSEGRPSPVGFIPDRMTSNAAGIPRGSAFVRHSWREWSLRTQWSGATIRHRIRWTAHWPWFVNRHRRTIWESLLRGHSSRMSLHRAGQLLDAAAWD